MPVHVKVPVDKPYPVSVPKPYNVPVERPYPVYVEKRVPYEVPVEVERPYPVKVDKPYPYVLLLYNSNFHMKLNRIMKYLFECSDEHIAYHSW